MSNSRKVVPFKMPEMVSPPKPQEVHQSGRVVTTGKLKRGMLVLIGDLPFKVVRIKPHSIEIKPVTVSMKDIT